jgi:transcriptional regulator with XRE-family HTH domain
VGYLVLTLREVAGLSQGRLARAAGTSQGAISRAESGNHTPSLPSLFRLANTVGYRVVVGFAAPDVATLDPATVEIDDLALVGMLIRDPLDGLPCYRVIREPLPWAGPRESERRSSISSVIGSPFSELCVGIDGFSVLRERSTAPARTSTIEKPRR